MYTCNMIMCYNMNIHISRLLSNHYLIFWEYPPGHTVSSIGTMYWFVVWSYTHSRVIVIGSGKYVEQVNSTVPPYSTNPVGGVILIQGNVWTLGSGREHCAATRKYERRYLSDSMHSLDCYIYNVQQWIHSIFVSSYTDLQTHVGKGESQVPSAWHVMLSIPCRWNPSIHCTYTTSS